MKEKEKIFYIDFLPNCGPTFKMDGSIINGFSHYKENKLPNIFRIKD
jgi:hypothetical protein